MRTRRQRVEDLGPRQRKILDFILGAIEERGYPPSVREIAEAVGLASPSTVHAHLEALQRKGYLRRDPTKPRAIAVHYAPEVGPVESKSGVRHVPLVGRVAAGGPALAVEEVEDVLAVPASLVGDGTLFMLRVQGESMTGAGIQPGDMVVVRKQDDATSGDVVVALIEDEATCKTYVLHDGRPLLRAENPAYDDVVVTPETRIVGKVVALLRSY
ncbi:MAG TPA: transcriptional repressor LexA [Actinomycetota bacterium]|nr:transcriptional repressor LexA [Actinomycetota bacterium]